METHHRPPRVLHVRGEPDEKLDVYETEWGPILAADHDGVPLALAWTAHRRGTADMELTRLEEAETIEEAIPIAQSSGIPAQNFIVGDRTGKIAWSIAGRIPARTGNYDPLLPADWSAPDTGWKGWLTSEQYPLIVNPPSQRLWSANARAIDGLMLERLGDGGYDLGARAKQIRDSLQQREHFTAADMLTIQLDDRALFLAHWRQLLELTLNQAEATPWRAEMQRALKDWDGHASTPSVAYRLVRGFRDEVIDSVLDGFAAAVRSKDPNFTMPKLTQAEHAVWKLIERRPHTCCRQRILTGKICSARAPSAWPSVCKTSRGALQRAVGVSAIPRASGTRSVIHYPLLSQIGWICQGMSCPETAICRASRRLLSAPRIVSR